MMITAPKHRLLEDAQGIAYGGGMAAFGITLLSHLGLVTGQTAGLAVLISYATKFPFGAVFFTINLPFYWLGYRRMGRTFMVKTFLSVALVSGLSMVMPQWINFAHVTPLFGALLFGAVSGSALLALFRHGASLGGIGILALIIQDRWGLRAGYCQLIFDVCLFASALLLRDKTTVAYSFLGAMMINLVIAINHRRDRYLNTLQSDTLVIATTI